MVNKDDISRVLDSVSHPETGLGLSSAGFVADVSVADDLASGKHVAVVLKFSRPREPFAASLQRQARQALEAAFPEVSDVSVDIASHTSPGEARHELSGTEPESKKRPSRVIAIASGKGGVGKSTFTAHLAATLAGRGLRVGILDADIYGPSQPKLFGVEGYLPVADGVEGNTTIIPAESAGVKIMSIGFFISPGDALVWRGPMATNALRQLIDQTAWGELDYLLVDLPPGTGDIHLTVAKELSLDGAIIVSTPHDLALADVRRGIEMFRSEGIGVPVLGIAENMAWFTPAELPDNKYYIFGKGGVRDFAASADIDFLGEIPLVMSAGDTGMGIVSDKGVRKQLAPYYSAIVDNISKRC